MYDSGPWGKSSTKDISVVDKFIDSLQRHNFIRNRENIQSAHLELKQLKVNKSVVYDKSLETDLPEKRNCYVECEDIIISQEAKNGRCETHLDLTTWGYLCL